MQRALLNRGFDPRGIDGIYGLHTETALKEALASPRPDVLDVLPTPSGSPLKVVRYDEAGGLDLRSIRHGGPVQPRPDGKDRYIVSRSQRPRVLVLHWTAGPTTANGLRDYMAKTERAVSSHFAVDPTGTYQYLPLSAWAYHATWINEIAIGIDICQPVVDSRLSAARSAGYTTDVIANPTRRGARKVLSLDPDIAAATRALVESLCEQFEIPMQVPRNADGEVRHDVAFRNVAELGDWSGVLGHHHVDSGKWDIAPWWPALFDGTALG